MNSNNKESAIHRARQTINGLRTKVAVAGTALMGTVGTAMATTPPAVDTSSITAEFDLYKVAVVGLVIAFAVVLWAKRGAGLLKPGG